MYYEFSPKVTVRSIEGMIGVLDKSSPKLFSYTVLYWTDNRLGRSITLVDFGKKIKRIVFVSIINEADVGSI